jgi:pimeloyl-ACP methyl ester carboxylesterase
MRRLGVVAIAIALLIYAAICGTLYATQRSLLYYPTRESQFSQAQTLRVATNGAVLKVWHLPSSGERAVLYFGGNSEDVAWNIDAFAGAFPNTDVYLVNYRGYGGSTGTPSESALLADAEAVFDEVRSRHPRVAVIGRSLGSGVAVHLAAARDVSKLVLVTPYDSVTRVAQRHFAFVPVAWLLRDTFDSFSKARNVRAPVLVLVAERDRVIPRAHSERLVTAFAPGQAEMRSIPGTNHDSIATAPEYRSALAAFLLY